jgi:hypothetical protein
VLGLEAVAIVPLVAIILVFAFYPQFGLSKSERSLKAALSPTAAVYRADATAGRTASVTP